MPRLLQASTVESDLRAEAAVQNRMLYSRILDSLRVEVVIVFILISFISPVLGGVSGSVIAREKTSFLAFVDAGATFVVISEFQNGFVVEGIQGPAATKGNERLIGTMKRISLAHLGKFDLKSVTFSNGLRLRNSQSHRVPFIVFWEQNFGLELIEDRR